LILPVSIAADSEWNYSEWDNDEWYKIQGILGNAIYSSGRGLVIDACEQLDNIIIGRSLNRQVIQYLTEKFNQFTGEKKLNAACFLLYFGEDYSAYIFYMFTQYYFYNAENDESNYLDLSELAGCINNIYAADLKIRICNSITIKNSISNLTVLYVGLTPDSKYYLYILSNLLDIQEGLLEASSIMVMNARFSKEDGVDNSVIINNLIESCRLLSDNITGYVDENNILKKSMFYFIYEFYPSILAEIYNLDPLFDMSNDPTGFEKYRSLFAEAIQRKFKNY
jgi:hypothetical protein